MNGQRPGNVPAPGLSLRTAKFLADIDALGAARPEPSFGMIMCWRALGSMEVHFKVDFAGHPSEFEESGVGQRHEVPMHSLALWICRRF